MGYWIFEIYSKEKHSNMCTSWGSVGFQNRQEAAGSHKLFSYFQTSQLDHLCHLDVVEVKRGRKHYLMDVLFQEEKYPLNTS